MRPNRNRLSSYRFLSRLTLALALGLLFAWAHTPIARADGAICGVFANGLDPRVINGQVFYIQACNSGVIYEVAFDWGCPRGQMDYESGRCKVPAMDPDSSTIYLLQDPVVVYREPLPVQLWDSDQEQLVTQQITAISGFTQLASCGQCPLVAPAPPTTRPQPTAVPLVNNAKWVADVTVPDGTAFAPNARFTKTWRVRNSGTTTWSSGYQLAFLSGDRMGSPSFVNLSRALKPGEQADLSVQLSAPAKPGTYRGTYQLRNAQGEFFGSKLTVVIKVPASTAAPTQTTPTAFTVTWMEIAPQVPMQNQTAVVQVFLDNAGPRDADYLTDFDGEIVLRNSAGQVVERQAFDHSHNDSFLPDAEALKKDLYSKKLVLTVRQVRFKQWADTATLEVWLRPLGSRSGTNVIKASMKLVIKADPAALTRCISFVSKKLSALPIGDVKWVLVATGASTRIGTCASAGCVAREIAELTAKLGKDHAMQVLQLALQIKNLENMTGAADCYNLAQ